MRPFVQLATVLSGSQPLLEPSGSSQIATSNSGRQRMLTDGRSQVSRDVTQAVQMATWLRDEEARSWERVIPFRRPRR